jgi:hypothetical protein
VRNSGAKIAQLFVVITMAVFWFSSCSKDDSVPLSPPPVVATPTMSPSNGTYDSAQSITISCTTSGATVRYTTNGSDPTESSTVYTNPISVASTTTLKARAWRSGYTTSAVASEVYTINTPIPCNVTMTSPNGGESWTVGTSHAITWSSSGDCGESVKLELVRNGSVCSTITSSTSNDGSYTWTASQCSGYETGYRIRVTDLTTGDSDDSNSDFSIPDIPVPCNVTMTSPNGGESWTVGTSHAITWSSSGDCGGRQASAAAMRPATGSG